MINKTQRKQTQIKYCLILLVIFVGTGCQKQQAASSNLIEQAKPILLPETEFQSWEWNAPSGCEPISISPDNSWGIFYCDQRKQPQSALSPGVWAERIEGNAPPTLLVKMFYWPEVEWSPDGTEVMVTRSREDIWVFQVGDWSHKQSLYKAAANIGGDNIPLPHGVPVWSPNSQYIATINPDLDAKMMLWQPGRKDTPLLYSTGFQDINTYFPPKLDIGPTWSSDSKRIAFLTTDRSNQFSRELWVWDVEQSKYEIAFKLENDPLFAPVWSPDGRLIAFSGKNEIVFYDLAEQALKRVPSPENDINIGSQKLWSPDSTRLIVRVDLGWWLLTLADEEWEDLGHPYSFIERWTDDGLGLVVQVKKGQEEIMKSVVLDASIKE